MQQLNYQIHNHLILGKFISGSVLAISHDTEQHLNINHIALQIAKNMGHEQWTGKH